MNKTLALLVRALRTESRDIKSHLFRLGLAVFFVLILWLGQSSIRFESAPGRLIFKWMTVANWVFITLAGGTFFAIAISEETEQQTLGLLRMANVGPLSLLLGKWLPRMLTAIVLISIQFPFTWLTVTLGGVSWQQIWASYLMLLAHLVLVGNLGLLASVLSPSSAKACGWTFAVMLIARFLPLFCWWAIEYGTLHGWVLSGRGSNFWDQVVLPLNNWSASGRLFGEILTTSFKGSAWNSQVISNLMIGAGLFVLAWLIFDPATMRHMSGGPQRRSLLSRLINRTTRSSGASWDWALGWKDFRQVGGGFKSVIAKTGFYLFLYGVIFYISRKFGTGLEEAWQTTSGVTANIIFWGLLPLELSFLAAKLFRPELNDQTWSTLLTLPKSLPEIAYSKLAGAMLGLIPTLSVLLICATPFLGDLLVASRRSPEFVFLFCYLFSAVLLALHLVTFFSVSIEWAAWPIAIILGVGVTFFGNLLVWVCFAMLMLGVVGGSGDSVFHAWVTLLFFGNLAVAGVTHYGIGLRLIAKGAQS